MECNNFYYLGIDLATRKTGIALLDKNKSLIRKKTIDLLEFSPENFLINFQIFKTELAEYNMPDGFLKIGIELSNFGTNAKFANHVHFYAGMLFLYLKSINQSNKIKFYNADRWFSQLKKVLNIEKNNNEILRPERKLISREFTIKKSGWLSHSMELLTEDECDAFCVAYFFDECENTITEISANKKKKKTEKIKKVSKKKQLEKLQLKIEKVKIQIEKYLTIEKVKKLTKSQKNKLENLKSEYEKLVEVKNEIRQI